MTELELCQQNVKACEKEIGKGIIGQKEIIRQVMLALLAGGNVLLEGMPGLGKTMLVRTISEVFQLSFKRIQFTPDLVNAPKFVSPVTIRRCVLVPSIRPRILMPPNALSTLTSTFHARGT